MSEAGLFDTETTPGRRDSESPPRRDVRVWTVVIYACVVLSKKIHTLDARGPYFLALALASPRVTRTRRVIRHDSARDNETRRRLRGIARCYPVQARKGDGEKKAGAHVARISIDLAGQHPMVRTQETLFSSGSNSLLTQRNVASSVPLTCLDALSKFLALKVPLSLLLGDIVYTVDTEMNILSPPVLSQTHNLPGPADRLTPPITARGALLAKAARATDGSGVRGAPAPPQTRIRVGEPCSPQWQARAQLRPHVNGWRSIARAHAVRPHLARYSP
ncbi:hypothetical protein C8J57DRAFT_1536222 [Mycena rebaudengoi]|nr:hypothetical protein C8J57DRAFT_1536222 [Mycena rebaudengoi]